MGAGYSNMKVKIWSEIFIKKIKYFFKNQAYEASMHD